MRALCPLPDGGRTSRDSEQGGGVRAGEHPEASEDRKVLHLDILLQFLPGSARVVLDQNRPGLLGQPMVLLWRKEAGCSSQPLHPPEEGGALPPRRFLLEKAVSFQTGGGRRRRSTERGVQGRGFAGRGAAGRAPAGVLLV